MTCLEERLNRDAPNLSWKCEPVTTSDLLEGTGLPEQIKIEATQAGVPVKGSPFYLSAECLLRWGLDASASLICNELTPHANVGRFHSGLDWDRLAEI
jgi:hypothetical protein